MTKCTPTHNSDAILVLSDVLATNEKRSLNLDPKGNQTPNVSALSEMKAVLQQGLTSLCAAQSDSD